MFINFYKYHGAGNDFIIVNNLDEKLTLSPQAIKYLCDRHFGIGADGFMELLPSRKNDFAMRYYNSDGKEGTMCGNGGRCIVAFAQKIGIIQKKAIFDAIDGTHKATIETDKTISLKMNDVNSYQLKGKNIFITDTGSPHYVQFTENINAIDVIEEGRKIRYSEAFPDGINVNFVEIKNDKIYMRTYERGVENETLACGTGTVAVAIAAHILKQITPPIEIHARGGILQVNFETNGRNFKDIILRGPATFVFEGVIEV